MCSSLVHFKYSLYHQKHVKNFQLIIIDGAVFYILWRNPIKKKMNLGRHAFRSKYLKSLFLEIGLKIASCPCLQTYFKRSILFYFLWWVTPPKLYLITQDHAYFSCGRELGNSVNTGSPGNTKINLFLILIQVDRTWFAYMKLSVKIRSCWIKRYTCKFKRIFLLAIFKRKTNLQWREFRLEDEYKIYKN